jgi:hypothetical protein
MPVRASGTAAPLAIFVPAFRPGPRRGAERTAMQILEMTMKQRPPTSIELRHEREALMRRLADLPLTSRRRKPARPEAIAPETAATTLATAKKRKLRSPVTVN